MSAMQIKRTLVQIIEHSNGFISPRHTLVSDQELERYLEMTLEMFCDMYKATFDPSKLIRNEVADTTRIWYHTDDHTIEIICSPQTIYLSYDEVKNACRELLD